MKVKLRSIRRLWVREDALEKTDWAALIVLVLYMTLFLLLIIPMILGFLFVGLPDRGAGFR